MRTFKTDRHVFEEVTEVPWSYSVWNIGRDNFPFPKCVPLCQEGRYKYTIKPDTLKFIELESEELALQILEEAGMRGCSRDKMLEMIRNYKH